MDHGEVFVGGEPVHGRDEAALFEVRARIGMLFQGGALFDGMTVLENVAFPLLRRGFPRARAVERARAELRAVGLAGSEDTHPDALSGGMRKRAAVARVRVVAAPVCLWDEPTAGLDPLAAQRILDLVETPTREGAAGIAVGHELSTLLSRCRRAAMLMDGRLIYHGSVAGLRTAAHPAVRQFATGALEGPL